MVTELCAGTLCNLINDECKGPEGGNREILRQITSGLKHLHDKNIVHRDLKPGNILVSFPDGSLVPPRIKLADFGLSRVRKDDKTIIERTIIGSDYSVAFKPFGTHGWIGPEMYGGVKSYSFWVDIFPLGCIFSFVLTKGGHPFSNKRYLDWDAEEMETIISAILNRKPLILTISDLHDDADKQVFELIESMLLTPDPSERPTSTYILNHSYFSLTKKENFIP